MNAWENTKNDAVETLAFGSCQLLLFSQTSTSVSLTLKKQGTYFLFLIYRPSVIGGSLNITEKDYFGNKLYMRIHSLTFILSYMIRYILLSASLIIFTGFTRKKNELYKRDLPSCKTRGIFKTKLILHFCDPIIAPDGKVCSMKCMYFTILYVF